MKKAFPIVLVVLLVVISGYFLMGAKKPGTPLLKKPEGNVFTSIQDALSKSLSLKCVYKDEQGVQTTTYIKGGAVRVLMEGIKDKEQPSTIIIKDKKMYMWNEISKTGFTYTITEPVITPGAAAKVDNKDASVLAGIEKYKDSCKTEAVADSFFVPPADVKFQDMSAFTENLKKQILPTGTEGQNAVNQDYINNLMKQVTPPAGEGQ
ncbi:MAG: hypothetical protein WC741_02140 [Patescibacteria group bacterium]|jgi:hypothetical protein